MEPLVSIGMSVFNGEATLAVAISSLINQTYQNWELILIDDGSSDGSLGVAKSFDDDRIKIFYDGLNLNLAARLNETVERGRGEYFARMDQDDVSFPERLAKQVNFMLANPDVDLVGTGALIFKGDGEILGVMPVEQDHQSICRRPWNGFHIPHPSWFGRRHWFLQNRYRSIADRAEDQDLLFRTYKESRFACLKGVQLGYRQESRPLKKLLLARLVVLKCFASEAKRSKSNFLLLQVVLSFLGKTVADILHHLLSVRFFRNRLLLVDRKSQKEWQKLWESLTASVEDWG